MKKSPSRGSRLPYSGYTRDLLGEGSSSSTPSNSNLSTDARTQSENTMSANSPHNKLRRRDSISKDDFATLAAEVSKAMDYRPKANIPKDEFATLATETPHNKLRRRDSISKDEFATLAAEAPHNKLRRRDSISKDDFATLAAEASKAMDYRPKANIPKANIPCNPETKPHKSETFALLRKYRQQLLDTEREGTEGTAKGKEPLFEDVIFSPLPKQTPYSPSEGKGKGKETAKRGEMAPNAEYRARRLRQNNSSSQNLKVEGVFGLGISGDEEDSDPFALEHFLKELAMLSSSPPSSPKLSYGLLVQKPPSTPKLAPREFQPIKQRVPSLAMTPIIVQDFKPMPAAPMAPVALTPIVELPEVQMKYEPKTLEDIMREVKEGYRFADGRLFGAWFEGLEERAWWRNRGVDDLSSSLPPLSPGDKKDDVFEEDVEDIEFWRPGWICSMKGEQRIKWLLGELDVAPEHQDDKDSDVVTVVHLGDEK